MGAVITNEMLVGTVAVPAVLAIRVCEPDKEAPETGAVRAIFTPVLQAASAFGDLNPNQASDERTTAPTSKVAMT